MHFLPRPLAALLAFAPLIGCANTDDLTGGNPAGGAPAEGGGGQTSMPQSSSTGIGPCDEDPCKLIEPQCGCEEDLACNVDSTGMRLCALMGSGVAGSPCSETALCGPGLKCVGYGPDLLSCAKFCSQNNECEMPGGKCEIELDGVVGVKLCTENCDLITNQGCAVAGTSCQYGLTTDEEKPYTLCAPSGDSAPQVPCTTTADCAPGSACLPNSVGAVLCFQWCLVGVPDSCPADTACIAYEAVEGTPFEIGDVEYGTCNPV